MDFAMSAKRTWTVECHCAVFAFEGPCTCMHIHVIGQNGSDIASVVTNVAIESSCFL